MDQMGRFTKLIIWSIVCSLIGLHPALGQDTLRVDTVFFQPEDQAIEVHISFRSLFEEALNQGNLTLTEVQDSIEYLIPQFERIDSSKATGETSSTTYHIFHLKKDGLTAKSHNSLYLGEARLIRAEAFGESDQKRFIIGSASNPVNLGYMDWQLLALVGALLVSLILAILSQLIPEIRGRRFFQKYVKQYKDVDKKRYGRVDPYTSLQIKDEELVVVKCRQIQTLGTWQKNDNKCINYAKCLRKQANIKTPCKEGEGLTPSEVFFSQQGVYRILNWIWFGAFGGLMAWVAVAFLFSLSLPGLYRFFSHFSQDGNGYVLMQDTLTGFFLGLFLSFMLSLAEERGQSRMLSWTRILLRAIGGGLIAALIFWGAHLTLDKVFGPDASFVIGLLTWTVFGVALGGALSIQSSISTIRGLIGGGISGAIAFVIYYFPLFLNQSELGRNTFEWTKMLAFIMLGSLLALTLISVVRRYEGFELEYLSPKEFRRVNPISKWLKIGMQIYIGTDKGCYVYIHWDDPAVQPEHADLTYKDGKVLITPLHPVLLNGRELPLHQETELKNNDEIQLGIDSVTHMRFRLKEAVNKPSKKTVNRKKPEIKIYKRN